MRIAVVGVGHVGLATAACLTRWAHDVIGMDDAAAKVAGLRAGRMPFFEAGLQELVAEDSKILGGGFLQGPSDVVEDERDA